ncbi:MAG: DedA family protein [Oligoflexia bacterium]|nr:DedA family protein [Oligoflexia bacterium]MBF0367069.1 DedA family protein [Oligoflexia bacterium]
MKAAFLVFANWLVGTIWILGYSGIVLLMAIESSIIPLPSEIIMPPAGYLISTGEMSWLPVILAGTIGSWIGACANYAMAKYLGRPFVLRFGKYFLVREAHLQKCDYFFQRHGEIATFIGRLLPGVRHLISIPAGLTCMNFFRFSLYTLLGAGIWVSVLTYLGYLVGTNKELLHQYLTTTTAWVLAVVGAISVAYYFYHKIKSGNQNINRCNA